MATLAVQNNNPGDLRFAGQPGATQGAGGFAAFPNEATGTSALENDLTAKVTGNTKTGLKPTSTLAQFASTYAPASDGNDPATYAANLAKQLGVTTDTPLSALQGRIHDFATAVAHNEDATSTLDKAHTGTYASEQTSPLTHAQLISNINAMEQQGAKPQEIQSYLDSLKGTSQQTEPQPTSTGGLPAAPTAPQPLQSATQDLSAETPAAPADNLGTDLSTRLQEGTQAASQGIAAASQGDVLGAASGALQTVGAGAGAIGDVVNRGLELIPGVKQVEGLLGQGVGALAQTPTGQKVAQSIQSFTQAHPELSKDIGAGFNIVTAIPILSGLGVAGDVAGDAVAQGLKGVAEKSFVDSAPDIIGSTKAGSRFISANPTVAKDMVDRRLVGDIANGEFTTKAATQKSWNTIRDLNTQVKSILSRPEFSAEAQDGQGIAQKAISGFTSRTGDAIDGIPQSGMTPSDLIANAKKLDSNNSLLWDKFEAGQANWNEINELRSSLDSKVKKVFIGKASIDSPEVATSKENGALLSGAMRDSLQTAVPQTAVPFGEMGTQFKIQKALEFMDGKKVKPGGLAKFAGHVVGTGTGGAIGGVMGGAPGALIGGMIGDRTAGAVADRLAGKNIVQGILKRTGANAVKTPLKKGLLKAGGAIASSEAQKLNKP